MKISRLIAGFCCRRSEKSSGSRILCFIIANNVPRREQTLWSMTQGNKSIEFFYTTGVYSEKSTICDRLSDSAQ